MTYPFLSLLLVHICSLTQPLSHTCYTRVFQYVLECTPVNEAHLDPDFVEAAGPLADLAKKRDKETRRIEIPATEVNTLSSFSPFILMIYPFILLRYTS